MNLKVTLYFSVLAFCGLVESIFFSKDKEGITTETYNLFSNDTTNKPETTSHRSFFNKLFGSKTKSPFEADKLNTSNTTNYHGEFGAESDHAVIGTQVISLKPEVSTQSIFKETIISQGNNSGPSDTNLLNVCKALNLSMFLDYMQSAGLTDVLYCKEPVTVFAPSNEAFSAMDYREKNAFYKSQGPESRVSMILKNHISKGNKLKTTEMKNDQLLETMNGTVKIIINIYKDEVTSKNFFTVTGAKISNPDKEGGSQCVLHVIDKVLTKFPTNTIVETLKNTPKFKTFVKALEDTGVLNEMNGPGPFTLFAPIEQAMIKATAEKAKTSKDILKNHIVSGYYFTPSLHDKLELVSLQGSKLLFEYHKSVIADMIRVNNATLFETDIPCVNGVIHAVNNILDISS